MDIADRMKQIRDAIKRQGSALIALSGGVDSSVVAALAFDALGENSLAVTVDAGLLNQDEVEDAKKMAEQIGILHMTIALDLLNDPNFVRNPADRCYYCKKKMITGLKKVARSRGINTIVDGTTVSDINERRPGYRVIKEEKIFTPLLDYGVTKNDVREMAARLQLPVAEKPSNACLATRIPYGQKITREKLRRISMAEHFLHELGIGQLRVRDHNGMARIEVLSNDMPVILENANHIVVELKRMGFVYITLDLMGYRCMMSKRSERIFLCLNA